MKSFKVALNYLQRDMISISFICASFVLYINFIPFGHDKNKNKEYIYKLVPIHITLENLLYREQSGKYQNEMKIPNTINGIYFTFNYTNVSIH